MSDSAPEDQRKMDRGKMAKGFALLVAVYCFIVYVIPRPEAVKPEGWRLTGLFFATIVGSIVEPIPAGALVLLAVVLSSLVGGLTITEALAGYSNSSVWLVLVAFFISRALIQTGLARRIALFFVRAFGKSSLGVAYSLAASDMVLAGMIPSNGARAGGVVLPIARSISELYGSHPGETAGQLGSFLMIAVYQAVCITSAMFMTGQVSNFLARDIAMQAGYELTPLSWIRASIVPGLLSLITVPWIAMKLNPPAIKKTPEASTFAAEELAKLGPMKQNEWILTAVFLFVCYFWIRSRDLGIDVAVTALLGCMVLLLTGVLAWDDIPGEKGGWAVFIWYGGLLRLAQGLNDAGVTKVFADYVAATLGGNGWPTLFGLTILIYFYAHYAFASITAHTVSMFPAFLAVLIASGAPIGLVVYTFVCLGNVSACLTHYGTTPAPIFYAQGYVPLKMWWKIGAVASVANLIIWTTAGFGWWKVLGIW
jgi:divalent anion:Na+ symporter, DASS family